MILLWMHLEGLQGDPNNSLEYHNDYIYGYMLLTRFDNGFFFGTGN